MAFSVAGALLVIAVAVAWSIFEVRWLAVRRVVVSDPDVPPGFNGAKIAFVTDIHAGDLLGPEHVRMVAAAVDKLDADVVLMGGDYVGGSETGLPMFEAEARHFSAPYGTVGVLGNHEAKWDLETATRRMRELGIVLLNNDNVRVMRNGDTIRVAGIGDGETRVADPGKSAKDISPKEFAILLAHNPDRLPFALTDTRGAFDLALSGHLHGGQVTVFGLWAPVLPSSQGQRFRGGWTEVEDVPVLVSRGAGAYLIPARFFARPEIHLIELRQGPAGVQRLE